MKAIRASASGHAANPLASPNASVSERRTAPGDSLNVLGAHGGGERDRYARRDGQGPQDPVRRELPGNEQPFLLRLAGNELLAAGAATFAGASMGGGVGMMGGLAFGGFGTLAATAPLHVVSLGLTALPAFALGATAGVLVGAAAGTVIGAGVGAVALSPLWATLGALLTLADQRRS